MKTRRLCLEGLESRRVLTDVSGTLSGTVNWTASQNPIRLVGDVFVPAGVTLNIQPGVIVTKANNFTLRVANSGDGGIINANQATFNIDVSLGANSSGLIQASRWNTDTLMIGAGSSIQLAGNSFHSGSTQDTTPIWVAPNLTSKLAGSVFDNAAAEATQIGVFPGIINNQAVTWSKLPGVAGYRILHFSFQNNDIAFNSGASLTIASGNTLTREDPNVSTAAGTLIVGATGSGSLIAVANVGERINIQVPVSVGASSAANFTRATFTSTANLAGTGSVVESRFDAGRLEIPASSSVTLAGNSFHSGLTQNTSPIWIASNLTHRLAGSVFDNAAAEATQIGVFPGIINNQAVTWSKLPGVAGYRILHFSFQNNDIAFNSGASLTIASGNTLTREDPNVSTAAGTLIVGATGSGSLIAVANVGERINIQVPVSVGASSAANFTRATFTSTANLAGTGSVVESRFDAGRLEIPASSSVTLAGNSFHSGLTQNTSPIWIASNLTHRLAGSVFDNAAAEATQIGVFPGIINNQAVTWSKLPGVAGYRILHFSFQNNDIAFNSGASLTIASGNTLTREDPNVSTAAGTLIVGATGSGSLIAVANVGERINIQVPVSVGASSAANFTRATFTSTANLAGTGSVVESRFDAGRLEIPASSSVTLAGNSFHSGLTQNTSPIWIASNLTHRLAGSVFDNAAAEATQVGIYPGIINNQAVTWSKLPGVAGYRILHFSFQNNDIAFNSGASLTIASGNTLTREDPNVSTAAGTLIFGSATSASLDVIGGTFSVPVILGPAAQGTIASSFFTPASTLTIHAGSNVMVSSNDLRLISQVFAVGSPNATIGLDGNYWGTTIGSEIEAKITHRPDTSPFSRPLVTYANPIAVNALGGMVWDDANADGFRSNSEIGRPNVTVRLRGAGVDGLVGTSDDDQLSDVPSVVTSSSGAYQIIVPAQHVTKRLYVEFTKPGGTDFTIRNVSSAGDTRDSDVDGFGRSDPLNWFDKRVDFTTDAGLVAQAPEIEISIGGIDLFDGWSRVNFGQTNAGTPVSRTFVVTNSGNAPLTLTQPFFASGSGFAVSQPLSTLTLAPGASTNFGVTMTAQVAGSVNARLQLVSNDGDEGTFDLTLLGDVQAVQSQTDIRVLSVSSNGASTVTVQYEIAIANAPTFSFGVYRTENGTSLTGAQLLDSFDITLPSELSIGTHSKTFTLGGNANEIAFPGLGDGDVTNADYRILFVADPGNSVAENDVNPLSEDNQSLFVGAYKAGSTLFVHGSDGPDTITFAPSGANHLLTINGGTPLSYTSSSITTLYVRSHAGADTINGGTATRAMNVMGGEDNDVISTGTGADTLRGNGGDDQLSGGAGNDLYVFDADSNLGVDALTDATGIDTLDFSETASGITVDLASVTTQTVNSLLGLVLSSTTSFDNVVGGSGNDVLIGNSGANSLTGNGGNDQLAGGSGNDTYLFVADTPLGSDTLTDTSGLETISFAGTTSSGVLFSLGLTTPQVVNPRLTLTLGSATTFDNVIGGSGTDTLTGNTAANQLTGGAGNDALNGGAGNDTYLFDADSQLGTDTINESLGGVDTLSFALTTTKAIALDLGVATSQVVNSNLSLILGATNTIESILGGGLADTLTGNGLANLLAGNAGDDILVGLDGGDELLGGAGNDTLRGGAGDDLYGFDVDTVAGSDTVDETGGSGVDTLDFSGTTTKAVTVDLSTSGAQITTPTNHTLTLVSAATSIENVIGGSLNDVLTGNGLDNRFKGNGGNDQLLGGAGNDLYQFDIDVVQGSDTINDLSGIDGLDFSQTTGQKVTLDLSLANQVVHANLSLAHAAGTNIENAIGGSKDDTLLGNGLDNLLSGGGGNDILRGGNGKDVILGGAGNDTLEGGDADDLLISGTTSHDSLYANLRTIQNAWSSADPYATRVANLRAGIGGVALTAKTTVLNSGVDSLRGDAGQDWYFAGLDDTLVDLAVNELNDVL